MGFRREREITLNTLLMNQVLKTDSLGLFTITRLIESMIKFTYNKLTSVFQFSYAFHTILITNLKIYNKLIVKGLNPGVISKVGVGLDRPGERIVLNRTVVVDSD